MIYSKSKNGSIRILSRSNETFKEVDQFINSQEKIKNSIELGVSEPKKYQRSIKNFKEKKSI